MIKIIILSVAIFGAAIFVIYNFFPPQDKFEKVSVVEEEEVSLPERVTLSGTKVCLPYKENSFVTTDECVEGIMTKEGVYYALNFNLMSATAPEIENEDFFTATGVITLTDNMGIDNWQAYEAEGLFSVTGSVYVQSSPEIKEVPEVGRPCFVGGCSSQLCTDTPDMASTCEYREEYACYQTATCERQLSGQCGWSETEELLACLAPS